MGGTDSARPFRAAEYTGSRRQLRKNRKLLHGVYAPPDAEPTALVMARAAWLYGNGGAVLAGRSAAAVLGVPFLDRRRRASAGAPPDGYRARDPRYRYFDPEPPVIIRPRSGSRRACAGLISHRVDLPADEVVRARGMRVTSPERTGFDLGRWPASRLEGWDREACADLDQRIVMLDALCRVTRTDPAEIGALAERHPRAVGLSRLREALTWVDAGADSPPETRLRLLLIRRGFPAPRTQYPILNEYGVILAHVDLAWPRWKVGLEYDGGWHWEDAQQRTHDIVRYAELREHGWEVIRVDSVLLGRMQGVLIGMVEAALARAGAE